MTGTRAFVQHMRPRLEMYRDLVTENIILRKRLEGIGPISSRNVPQIRRQRPGDPRRRESPMMCARRSPIRFIRNLISISPCFPKAIPWPVTWCAWRRSCKACASSSRRLESCRQGPVMAEKVPRVRQAAAGDYFTPWKPPAAVHGAAGQRRQGDRLPLETAHPLPSNLSLFEEASQGMLLPDALALMGSLDLVIPILTGNAHEHPGTIPTLSLPGRDHVLCRTQCRLPGVGRTQRCRPVPTPPGPERRWAQRVCCSPLPTL